MALGCWGICPQQLPPSSFRPPPCMHTHMRRAIRMHANYYKVLVTLQRRCVSAAPCSSTSCSSCPVRQRQCSSVVGWEGGKKTTKAQGTSLQEHKDQALHLFSGGRAWNCEPRCAVERERQVGVFYGGGGGTPIPLLPCAHRVCRRPPPVTLVIRATPRKN